MNTEEVRLKLGILGDTSRRRGRSVRLSLSISLSLSLTHTHTHTHSISLSLSLTHTHTHSLNLSLSHTHTHTNRQAVAEEIRWKRRCVSRWGFWETQRGARGVRAASSNSARPARCPRISNPEFRKPRCQRGVHAHQWMRCQVGKGARGCTMRLIGSQPTLDWSASEIRLCRRGLTVPWVLYFLSRGSWFRYFRFQMLPT